MKILLYKRYSWSVGLFVLRLHNFQDLQQVVIVLLTIMEVWRLSVVFNGGFGMRGFRGGNFLNWQGILKGGAALENGEP
jgi:hypothetical protein